MSFSISDYESLVAAHYAQLYRFALSLVRNEPDASDLTQQAFYLLVTRGGQIRDTSKVKSWLATTLYREFLSGQRRSGRYETISMDSKEDIDLPSVDPDMARHLDGVAAVNALHQVPEPFRAPLSLFYLQDHSYHEIAEILDIPIGTVMSRLSRGKAELRRALRAESDQPPNIIPIQSRAI